MTESTSDVVEKHRFDEAKLIDYMNENVEGFEGPIKVSQFSGGQSNPTYKVDTAKQSYVLRRKPPGDLMPSAHAVDREFRVMSALNRTDFPAPKAYSLCEDRDVLGTEFYIMEFIPGRVLWNYRMPDETPESRGKIMRSLCETVAKLHTVDHVAVGLEGFGRPGNYFARQISRWTKTYRMYESGNIESMNKLIDWLPNNIPEDESVSLVHGDLSLHNVLYHPTEPRLVATLDWELATIGHPLGDLFYSNMVYYTPDPRNDNTRSFVHVDLKAAGLPTFEEYIDLYCELAGRGPIENPSFYKAFNLFRLAGITQGIIGRIEDGTANDPSADKENLLNNLDMFAEAAWIEAQRAGAV